MTPTEYRAALKRGGTAGAFLFYGDEDYLKRHALRETRERIVGGDYDFFNRTPLIGDSFSPAALMVALQTLPVMSDRRLIEIDEVNFRKMSASVLDSLCSVLAEAPGYEYVTVIIHTEPELFDAGTPRAPSKQLTALSACATPVLFAREEPAKLIKWVQKHFSAEGIFADNPECESLIRFCGCDMYTLTAETAKLCAYIAAAGKDRLTSEDIEAVACRGGEPDAFALSDALLSKNTDRAFAVLDSLLLRRQKHEIILSDVTRVICDMYRVRLLLDKGQTRGSVAATMGIHEYRARLLINGASGRSSAELAAAAARCYETDIKLKSSSADGRILLEALIIGFAFPEKGGTDH